MKKLLKIGVGLSLIATLVACSDEVNTSEVEAVEPVETTDLTTDEVLADEKYGKFIGFDEDGLKARHKTSLELEMLLSMQDGINATALDSTTNTFYIFSDNDMWTQTLMNGVRNNNADGELDEVIESYDRLVEVIPVNYNVVVSNPTNTYNALIYYENGKIVYSVFDE